MPPRRQSCDRCHGQKLRCTRTSDSETGPCVRCIRQRAECTYSSSLPKGRRSMYRLPESTSSDSTSFQSQPVPPPHSRQAPRCVNSETDSSGQFDFPMNTDGRSEAKSEMNSHNSVDLGSLFSVAVNPPMALSPANLHGAESHANEQDWSANLFGFVAQQIDADLRFLNTAPGLLSRENSLCSCLGSGLIKAIDGGQVQFGRRHFAAVPTE